MADLKDLIQTKADELAMSTYPEVDYYDLPTHIQRDLWAMAEGAVADDLAAQADAMLDEWKVHGIVAVGYRRDEDMTHIVGPRD